MGKAVFPFLAGRQVLKFVLWAVIISVGTLVITLNIHIEEIWFVPLFTSIMLFLLTGWILMRNKKKKN